AKRRGSGNATGRGTCPHPSLRNGRGRRRPRPLPRRPAVSATRPSCPAVAATATQQRQPVYSVEFRLALRAAQRPHPLHPPPLPREKRAAGVPRLFSGGDRRRPPPSPRPPAAPQGRAPPPRLFHHPPAPPPQRQPTCHRRRLPTRFGRVRCLPRQRLPHVPVA